MDATQISKIVIAGAGTMGASIAQVYAEHGFCAVLWNRSEEGIDRAKVLIEANQAALVASGRLTQEDSRVLLGRISYERTEDCFSDAEFVIESIVEDLAKKQEFYRHISPLLPEDGILVTNTSGLSVTALSSAVSRPERFCGMHWINPPHLIPLVEVIRGEQTAAETVDAVYQLALRAGKKPIRVKDVPGFILNRLQFAVMREALSLAESGAAELSDIDGAMKYGLGLRWACLGPFETADIGGLDIFARVAEYLFPDLSDRKDVPELLRSLYEQGDWGVKSGRGFYDYSGDKAATAVKNRDEKFIRVIDSLKP